MPDYPRLYWRAFRRVERRSRLYLEDATDANLALLAEACRLANRLATLRVTL